MAVQAENICFESMGFGQYAMCSTQDCFMGSVLGIEDGFCFGQELQHLDQQRRELHPLVDSYDNLTASSSSSFSGCGSLPVEIVQSLSSEFEKQRVEMDCFLQLEVKSNFPTELFSLNEKSFSYIEKSFPPNVSTLRMHAYENLS